MRTTRLTNLLPSLALCTFALLGTSSPRPASAAPSSNDPTGTWRLMKDQDGKVPKSGAVLEITLASGKFTFKAVQPDETVTDSGSYSVKGRQITVDDVARHELGTKVGLRIPLQRLHIFPATEAGIPA